jgi:membrane associated rhomboid family serine protease
MRMMPITRALLVANIVGYALQYLLGSVVVIHFALWPLASPEYVPSFEPWQLVTYAFLHDPSSIMHLLANMLALYMFGSPVESLLGPRRYAIYYTAAVLGAAVTQLAVMDLQGNDFTPTLGASGGVFGLLLAYGLAFPHNKLMLLFPPIPLPAWLFVTLYGVLELVLGVTGSADGVAHFAHLGGAAAGFALILYWRRKARRQGT